MTYHYDLTLAMAVKQGSRVIDYIFPLNEETWLPLDTNGQPLGPPSYKDDATTTVRHAAAGYFTENKKLTY